MAVAELKKLLIVTHKVDEENILKKLKSTSAVEVNPYTDKINTSVQTSIRSSSDYVVANVKKALDVVNKYREAGRKVASRAGKLLVKKDEYDSILKNNDFEDIIQNILEIEDEINASSSNIKEIQPQIHKLKKWSSYKGEIEDLKTTDIYTVKLGRIKYRPDEFDKLVEDLDKKNISVEKLQQEKDVFYVIVAYHNDNKKNAEEYLSKLSFEEAELGGYSGTIEENLNLLKKKVEYNNSRKAHLLSEIKKLAEKYDKPLTVYLDYIENNIDIENAINCGFSTESVSFYTAWVKEEDKDKIFSIVKRYRFTKVTEIKPEKGEVIPTVLENKPIFKPFEIVVSLYGVPRYFEIDPTPFVSLFFAAFFGLCLTDAGYGIILAILSLFFAFRMKEARNFLMLLFIGGIFTIVAGTLFNGWFGNLPSYIGIDKFFSRFAILGDPVKTSEGSMNFFRLALLVGVIQIIYGLFIKFFDSLRRRDFASAFFDALPWILIVSCLVIIFLSTKMAVSMQLINAPLFPASVSRYLIWLVIPSALIIILFSARGEKSWGFRLFMGFLNLTIVSGLTSYLGDFLSYIRLMALGLVTAGIAVAINEIAFQMLSIPIAGVVIMVIVLVFGHIFNLGINALSGFVHTLRLQYVEFFQKFYIGGGRPFRALKDKHKYVTIVD